MERYAWKATVLPGKLEEYIRRHNEIWPEMKDVLHQAGIRNYTIWNVGNELLGVRERRRGCPRAGRKPGRGPLERVHEGRYADGNGPGNRCAAAHETGLLF